MLQGLPTAFRFLSSWCPPAPGSGQRQGCSCPGAGQFQCDSGWGLCPGAGQCLPGLPVRPACRVSRGLQPRAGLPGALRSCLLRSLGPPPVGGSARAGVSDGARSCRESHCPAEQAFQAWSVALFLIWSGRMKVVPLEHSESSPKPRLRKWPVLNPGFSLVPSWASLAQ